MKESLATTHESPATQAESVYDGQVEEAQLQAWRKLHRQVVRVDFPYEVEGEGLSRRVIRYSVGYFKKLGLSDYQRIVQTAGDDGFKERMAIVDACWLGGDPKLRTDDVLQLVVDQNINKIALPDFAVQVKKS